LAEDEQADSPEGQGDVHDSTEDNDNSAADAAVGAKDNEDGTENVHKVLSRLSNEIQQVNSRLKVFGEVTGVEF